jgi:phospholipid/cholesterol/gamma-HCH transport system ATP-binding protein
MEHGNHNEHPVMVDRLRKSFGTQPVLDGVSIQATSGKIMVILGRSGTGKSVLLRLLAGLEKPDSGTIRIDGQEISGLRLEELQEVRKRIGFLFQQAALYDSLTIEENVAFPLRRHSNLSDADRRDRVYQLLSSVGMNQDQDKMPAEISGGMRKRVGLARALALDPKILMFDEPTAGLDPITAAEIGALITEMRDRNGITSIVVTHDLHAARSFGDRIVMLNEGKVLIDGTFEEFRDSREEVVKQFLMDSA